MVVCDGLTGLPDAIAAVWPQTITQTCVVHLLRNSFRYAGRQHYEAIAKALRPVYTAPTETAAMERFLEFAEAWGERYPAIVRLWENAWAEFVPFLSFDVEIRKIICTTNAIVIWSRSRGVLDVVDEHLRSRVLPGGRGYLPPSSTWIAGRFDVRSAGGATRFAA
jgi:transposase-like protein